MTVCDVQSDVLKTAYVTQKGKYVFKRLSFGIANIPWIFQRVMSLTFANIRYLSCPLVNINDFIACFATKWGNTFTVLQAARFTLKPCKVRLSVKDVKQLGYVRAVDRRYSSRRQ